MNKIGDMTQEEREEALRRRKEKVNYYKSLDTRQDFADENYWRELARSKGATLPFYYYPGSKSRVRKFLRKLGVSQSEFEEISGGKLDDLINLNPKWPSYALCGVAMELMEE